MSMANITTEEREKILFLRDAFHPEGLSKYLNNDTTLLRWLRQNKLDLEVTVARLKQHIAYRNLLKLDREDTSSFPQDQLLSNTWPFCWIGSVDKNGSPIVVRLAGKVDIEGSLNSVKTSNYVAQELIILEKRMRYLTKMSEELRRIVGICLILDLDGLQFDPRNISLMTTYFKPLEEFIVDQNYPMIEQTIILINAPRLIASIYGLLRSLWPSMNVHIFNHNYQNNLLELVDRDQLPEMFGGTLKEEEFASPLVVPQKVPPGAYYNPDSDPENTFPVQVRARTKIRLELPEVAGGTKISWFYKGDHDIGFGIFRVYPPENSDSDPGREEMVVPKHRGKTDIVAETGEYRCQEKGKYVLDFCNAHSRLMWKNLTVAVSVTDPEGEEISWTQKELPSYL